MAAMRGPRVQVGSAAWVSEERSSALQIVESDVEEFSYSARNEMDWLNEHMAGIFDENETNFAETFKTPGKLRGKTPRTARKPAPAEGRVPLSDVFAATPNAPSSHFSQQLNRIKSPQTRPDVARDSPEILCSPSPRRAIASPKPKAPAADTQDSGYYGSQDMIAASQSFRGGFSQTSDINHAALHTTTHVPVKMSPVRVPLGESPEKTFQTAREEQTTRPLVEENVTVLSGGVAISSSSATTTQMSSPLQNVAQDGDVHSLTTNEPEILHEDNNAEDDNSASEASSPIRPMDRKSSLNFAPLPAREPRTAVKANGGRLSHLDHNRTSFYSRMTGGKSLGNVIIHNDDNDEADHDEDLLASDHPNPSAQTKYESLAADHHKTYTQRLQDRIGMLGKSQSHAERRSKSISDGPATHKAVQTASQAAQVPKSPSPLPTTLKSTPGAFPEDEDDWIEPPTAARDTQTIHSPRPALPKSYTADIMEGLHDNAVSEGAMELLSSPQRQTVHAPNRPMSALLMESSSMAAPAASPLVHTQNPPLHKAATMSDLRLGSTSAVPTSDTGSKSPTRSYHGSPLKQVRHKFSSILKSSRDLITRGAALSAEGKLAVASPSMTRLAHFTGPSMESLAERPAVPAKDTEPAMQGTAQEGSPTRPVGKRTRASLEKEKEEKKRDKEARRAEEQNEKLERVRAQEREKARDFSKEVAEKQVPGSWKDSTQLQKTPKPTRSSPRKPRVPNEGNAKQLEPDVEMADAPSTIPQPAPRSAGPASALRTRELKRPVKPVKETLTKSRQAPTVIRVMPGSQHSQYQTSTSATPAAPVDSDPSSQASQGQPQLSSKASKASLQSKPSAQNLRAAASAGRPKALDAAAKKKEQDEREAQRRREAKAELERKRLAAQEEQRKADQQKRQEAERQKQREREQMAQADVKKNAQRQAAIEKAKHTRAPPPAVRTHANAHSDSTPQENRASALPGAKHELPRPPSRMTAGMPRSQEENGRPATSQTVKAGVKRVLPTEQSQDSYRAGPSRAGSLYQANDGKRIRTSNEFDERTESDRPSHIKGPPVRPSVGFKKDAQAKSTYNGNNSNAPPSATRDLFKATVTAQHHGQAKSTNPMDMAQISKGAIAFAPNASTATGQPAKTPMRTTAMSGVKHSAAKSVAKSSPKFPNGEDIVLDEIQTDDEDEDEDEGRETRGMVASWANSPALRQALVDQEPLDPGTIFGPPRPLIMEEVFFKSKEKFNRFRARTSSANWSGDDRLTEEDIRKDLAARDKMRRDGGWSFDMSTNLL